jgi:hypothetical protein
MGSTLHFIAMPFDRTEKGLVAGEFFKCKSPESAIERAKGLWQVLGGNRPRGLSRNSDNCAQKVWQRTRRSFVLICQAMLN